MSTDEKFLHRFSLNQISIAQSSLAELIEASARAGVGAIAPWRDGVAELGLDRTSKLLRDAGLQVSSLCRGGFFTYPDEKSRANSWDENRRAVDEAVALGADCLVLVCGPPWNKDLRSARQQVSDGVAELASYAQPSGLRLAIEPLHPMMISDRSVICTLGEALRIAEGLPVNSVGVIVDAYHVWWDPNLQAEIARAGERIFGFHVSDWRSPADVLADRAVMGDGLIDLRRMREWVEASGFRGPIEVEVISASNRGADPDELFARLIHGFLTAL